MLIVIFGFGLITKAQNFGFGPELGTNLVMLEKTNLGRDYHLCWFAGGRVEYKFFDHFSLRSGVYFSHRKKTFTAEDTSQFSLFGFEPSSLGIPGLNFNMYTKTKTVVSLFGVEVPFLATFNHKNFSVFAGPYINFGVGAWSKITEDGNIPFLQAIEIDSIDDSGFLSFFFPDGQTHSFYETSDRTNFLKFDYGLKTGISYEANNLGFNLYYLLGIPGFMVDKEHVQNKPHRYFSFTINYNIDWKKQSRSSFTQ